MKMNRQNILPNANSLEYFFMNWKLWKLMGLVAPHHSPANSGASQRCPAHFKYIMWNYFINITASFIFTLHLFLAIFSPGATTSERFEGSAIFITSLCASFKWILYCHKMKDIQKLETILQTLDARVKQAADKLYFRNCIGHSLIYMDRMYVIIYSGVGLCAFFAFIARGERKLIFPGWLPFDWQQSWWHFVAALCFQLYGIIFQTMKNLSCDSFSPKALCILTVHVKLLYKRVARIGYDASLKLTDHHMELKQCVLHQKDLYELFNTIQGIISWPIFFQLFVSLVNLGVAMVALVYFVTDFFYQIYYIVYLAAMILQLFPVCYYGSAFVLFCERLHYAVFSCNWIGQSKPFKRDMMLFAERSLKTTMAMAGGVFPIHLTTFFATCKGAYSMFAVIITMK